MIEKYGMNFYVEHETGYYRARVDRGHTISLHRCVYEHEIGAVPEGYHVHHIDFDRSNNEPSNLIAVSTGDHARLHVWDEDRKARARKNLIEYAVPKSKAWHKSKEGHDWHVKWATINAKNRGYKSYVCKQCGDEYTKKDIGPNHDFCSNKCKSKYRRISGVDNITRTCKACGEPFTVNKYSDQECCSRKCARKFLREN